MGGFYIKGSEITSVTNFLDFSASNGFDVVLAQSERGVGSITQF